MYTRSKLNVLVRIRLKEKSYKRRYNIYTHICSLQCSGQKKWKYFVQKLSLMIGRILRCIKIMDELLAARYIHWNVLFILDFVRIVEIKKLHKNTRLRLLIIKHSSLCWILICILLISSVQVRYKLNLKQIDCEFHQITFQKKINISFPSIFQRSVNFKVFFFWITKKNV